MPRARLLAPALALLALGLPALAADYSSVVPRDLHALLESRIDALKIDETQGDTTLEGEIDGHHVQVYFYSCDGNGLTAPATPESRCLGFEYRAYFADYDTATRKVNQWNADNHYGKLYVDEDGDLALQVNVLVEGGIAERNILKNLDWFRQSLESVQDAWR